MSVPVGEMCDNNSSYSNGICFLSNEDFDYMVTTKHVAEEAIGWKLLPENTVFRVEKMNPIQTKWDLDVSFSFAMQMVKISMYGLHQMWCVT